MARLYLIPLPDADAQSADDSVASRVEQAGLLEEGGVATEAIGTDDVDVTVRGQWRFGERFAKKVARELESLAASGYEALALFEADTADLGRKTGYYEIESVDVNPAHPSSEDVFEYTVGLGETGTHETHWRAVKTAVEDVDTTLADGDGGLVGIHADARKTRWFDADEVTEPASVETTRSGEFADVALYDPDASTFDDPTLLYELDFEDEGPADVRVFDDRGLSKWWVYEANGETVEVNRWPHVYHTAAEYEGAPVLDNGLLRLHFDEDAGEVTAEEWNAGIDEWGEVTLNHGDLELFDADLRSIGPAGVTARVTFAEPSGVTRPCLVKLQRGIDGVLVRKAPGHDLDPAIEDLFEPIASDQPTDPNPAQTVIARSETD